MARPTRGLARMQAVILAGGLGTRLRPLTYETPKPMVNVLGKPFLHHLIEMLKEKGFDSFVICSSYKNEKIRDYFGSGKKFGVKIDHSVEATPLGTAGAVRNALFYLKDDFFVLNGDTYLDIDYGMIEENFQQVGKPAMMVLYEGDEIKERVDNVAIGSEGIVTAFNKGESPDSKYGWAGALLLRKKYVEKWRGGTSITLENEIFPKLIKEREMASCVVNTRYYDIGTIEKLRDFEAYLRGKDIKREGD